MKTILILIATFFILVSQAMAHDPVVRWDDDPLADGHKVYRSLD